MGIHTIKGTCEGRDCAAMVDSVTGCVFGPLFRSEDDCNRFQFFARQRAHDFGASGIRDLEDGDLMKLHLQWLTLPECRWCHERVPNEIPGIDGIECEDRDGYLCAPAGSLDAGPIGAPDHDEPGITRSDRARARGGRAA